MKITFGLRGDTVFDITNLLDEEAKIVLTQEIERDAFVRTVEDLTLRVSNMLGFFSDLFRDAVACTRFIVTVSEGNRVLFRGEVDNESIRFDQLELWVSMDVFSMNRLFWERAKSTRVNTSISAGEQILTMITLQSLLVRELGTGKTDAAGQPFFQEDIFSGFAIDELYAGRFIRFSADTENPQIGNNGKYANLDPATTINDLLTAMSVYYNAEFFINPETNDLTMRKRLSPNGNVIDLKGNILDDGKIDVVFLDRNKYDYLYTMYAIANPMPPVFDRFDTNASGNDYVLHVNPSGREKEFTYYLTYLLNDSETPPSEPLKVMVPPTILYTDPLGITHIDARDVRLTIPQGYPGTTRRFLYRTEAIPVGSASTQIKGPEIDITNVASGRPALVTTSVKHNFSAGDEVECTETGSIPSLKGTWTVAEITSDTSFTIDTNVVIAGTSGTVRRIYGLACVDLPNVYLLAVIEGNEIVSYRDGTDHSPRCNTAVVMPHASPVAVSAWLGYDESIEPHAWLAPIPDVAGGANAPAGRIFDAVPRLNFVSPNTPGQVNPYSLYDVFSFFGKDNEFGPLTAQWENLLRTIRGFSCRVKGINFRVGDEVLLSGILPVRFSPDLHGRLIVKKASIDLLKEETELELVNL